MKTEGCRPCWNEGIDVWRPVEAQRLSPDTWLIVDQGYDQTSERWEFQPGAAVRCRKEKCAAGVAAAAARQSTAPVST
jgi:hypothetical protein